MERSQSSNNLMSKATIFEHINSDNAKIFPNACYNTRKTTRASSAKGLSAYSLYFLSFSDNCRTRCGRNLADVSSLHDSDEMDMKY